MELSVEESDGHNVIILAGSTKYSPLVGVDFYFGRRYPVVTELEKRLGISPSPYHIQQYSPNLRAMKGINFTGTHSWSVDITHPPAELVAELANAIRGIAEPFFKRFASIQAAREALAANDPWCFGGKIFWRQLLRVDLALNDPAHFEEWAREHLGDFERAQAATIVERYVAQTDVSQRLSTRCP